MSGRSHVQVGEGTEKGGSGDGGGGLTPDSFPKLCSEIGSLIRIPDEDFSDLTVVVDGKRVRVHRCILAARCINLRKILRDNPNGKELELSSVVEKVGFDAFMTVLSYVYSGNLEPWPARVECCHPSCSHLVCRPSIDLVLEILRASQFFGLPEVTTVAQEHLNDCLGKLQVDDVLHVRQSVSTSECSQLQSACLTALASSSLDNLILEREFSGSVLERVRQLRKEMGLDRSRLTPDQEKQCKRIHRALNSDDLELVRLLLDEKKIDLNGAHALHYAAAYCHPRTLENLLDMELSDTSVRDSRGMTVLHVAAWRREPRSIAILLEAGANLKDCTSENQTVLDISRCLMKKSNLDRVEIPKERLCLGILEQAAKKETVSHPSGAAAMMAEPTSQEQLMSALLYLENRGVNVGINTALEFVVSLARLMYPQESGVVCSHLDTYAPFVSSSGSGQGSRKRKISLDLNEEPAQRLAGLVGVAVVEESKEKRLESLRLRYNALRKAAEMGRKYFPSFSAVIDKYVLDDDLIELIDEGDVEAQLLKKNYFAELNGILQDSFPGGKGSNDDGLKKALPAEKKVLKKPRILDDPSSPSSTSSSRGTSGSMVTMI